MNKAFSIFSRLFAMKLHTLILHVVVCFLEMFDICVEVFASCFDISGGFRMFSDLFAPVQAGADLFGYIGMSW